MHHPSLHLVRTRLRVALLLALACLPLQAALATPINADSATPSSTVTEGTTATESSAADIIAVLDSHDHDVDYFFTSRLQGEPDTGVDDIHYHVFEPRSLRLSLRYAF